MKKKLVIILTVIACMAMVACDKKTTSTEEKGSIITPISGVTSTSASASTSVSVEEPEPEPEEIPDNTVFLETVTMGKYPQSSEAEEPIEWIVLDKKDGKALVISKYILDAVPFVKGFGESSWEKSSLRKWLNKDFLKQFSGDEQAKIVDSFVPTEAPTVVTDAAGNEIEAVGAGTTDKIFLLSDFEVLKYLVDDPDVRGDEPYAKATSYAASKGVWVLTQDRYTTLRYTEEEVPKAVIGSGWWWLRTMGSDEGKTKDMDTMGKIRNNGHDNGECHDGIRPAMWIIYE